MSEISSKQGWIIKCASGLDVRGMDMSYEEAYDCIAALNTSADSFNSAVSGLILHGAKGKAKAYKPYTKKTAAKKTKIKKSVKKSAPKESVKDAAHRELYERAHDAGMKAAEGHTPVPMIVQQHSNVMDDNSPVVQSWNVGGGVCGFSWTVIRPGNCSFANWMKKNGKGKYSEYERGVLVWAGSEFSDFGQSMTTKEAYSHAFANVISDAGINITTYSRMD
jgi:hypothetical protein